MFLLYPLRCILSFVAVYFITSSGLFGSTKQQEGTQQHLTADLIPCMFSVKPAFVMIYIVFDRAFSLHSTFSILCIINGSAPVSGVVKIIMRTSVNNICTGESVKD